MSSTSKLDSHIWFHFRRVPNDDDDVVEIKIERVSEMRRVENHSEGDM